MNVHSISRAQVPEHLASYLAIQTDPIARFRDRLQQILGCAPDFIRPDQWMKFGFDDDGERVSCFARLDGDLQRGVFGSYDEGDLHEWNSPQPATLRTSNETWNPSQRREAFECFPQPASEALNLWQSGDVLREGDPAYRHITQVLGVPEHSVPACARFHAATPYRIRQQGVGHYAALLMPLQSSDGSLIGVQATYLQDDGRMVEWLRFKQRFFRVKGAGPSGFVPTQLTHHRLIGVARAVDDAMLATAELNVPTIATMTVRGMAEFEWPQVVDRMVVFPSALTSELAAVRLLVRRAAARGVHCTVVRPNSVSVPVASFMQP